MPADLPTLQRSPMPRQRLSSTGDYGMSARLGSLRLDVGRSDDFRPFGNFCPDLESTLIGRIGNRLEAKRCHALLDVRQHDNLDDLLIEQSEDLLGRSCWDEDSLPVLTLDVRVSQLLPWYARPVGSSIASCQICLPQFGVGLVPVSRCKSAYDPPPPSQLSSQRCCTECAQGQGRVTGEAVRLRDVLPTRFPQ